MKNTEFWIQNNPQKFYPQKQATSAVRNFLSQTIKIQVTKNLIATVIMVPSKH